MPENSNDENDEDEGKDLPCMFVVLIELLWILLLGVIVWIAIDRVWNLIF